MGKLNMADENPTTLFCRPKRLASARRLQTTQAHAKQESRKKLRKVSNILKKKETERTEDEISTLHQLPDIVKAAEKNAKRQLQQKERILEIEDKPDVLDKKCQELAQMLRSAKNAVIYTGAGISTAASIPDYRGPNGVWTLLRKGQSLSTQDLVDAEPTYTHMCITKLLKMGRVKYLVSQNCDGLHIRSGFPRHSMSEVHGNMFIEICKNCKPQKEYLRLFDVTERTAKRRHKTGRTCNKCGSELSDSIVHFGEKGALRSPYKWRQASKAASKSDLIICLGSSLKVLRRYPCLWRMDIRPEHRPKLVIVNLQWTPKDEQASLKINGRCDDVLRRVAQELGVTVPPYRRSVDPLFRLHTPVQKGEEHFASTKSLKTLGLKPDQQNVNKRKVFHKVPSNVPLQQPPLLRTSSCDGVTLSYTSQNSEPFKAVDRLSDLEMKLKETFSRTKSRSASDPEAMYQSRYLLGAVAKSENRLAPNVETSYDKLFSNLLANAENRPLPKSATSREKNGHIPDPLRLKLEQMLKERGVIAKAANMTSNGKIQISTSPSASLPSIHDFLQHSEVEGNVQQLSHPNLRHLLNSAPLQSQPASVITDHDVFRVDLSTNPISITTTHCAPNDAGSQGLWLTLDSVVDSSPTNVAADSVTSSSSASISDYAKVKHNIQFDHSYCKTQHKARLSWKVPKVPNTVRDSLSCSMNTLLFHQMPGTDSFSTTSVIPVCPTYGVAPQTINHDNNEQNMCSIQHMQSSQMYDHHCLPHVLTLDSNNLQDKAFVSLNSNSTFPCHPSIQFTVPLPAMQVHLNMNESGSREQLLSHSSIDSSSKPTGDNDIEESDEDSENHQLSKRRKKPESIPGWFGKGLRVRRKRTT